MLRNSSSCASTFVVDSRKLTQSSNYYITIENPARIEVLILAEIRMLLEAHCHRFYAVRCAVDWRESFETSGRVLGYANVGAVRHDFVFEQTYSRSSKTEFSTMS